MSDEMAALMAPPPPSTAMITNAVEASAKDRKEWSSISLRIVFDKNSTGFETTKEWRLKPNDIVAGRYRVLSKLGEAAFSIVYKCIDQFQVQDKYLKNDHAIVCLKMIKNSKENFDQSLDEIKMLRYINALATNDQSHYVLQLHDYFYCCEHLFIVTECLSSLNLYQLRRKYSMNTTTNIFTLKYIQNITKHLIHGIAFLHSIGLMHCDMKPENIVMSNLPPYNTFSSVEDSPMFKIIDYGSTCFNTDRCETYIQSRTYRAPEVILGIKYNNTIDMWSIGCILYELWTGQELFFNDSIR